MKISIKNIKVCYKPKFLPLLENPRANILFCKKNTTKTLAEKLQDYF